jgi:uncharacterized protein
MQLEVLDGMFGIARLGLGDPVPAWAQKAGFVSVTRTREELSIVCSAAAIPSDVVCRAGWRCLRVAGVLDFSLTGVLSSLAEPLARAGIPIFVISTFNTDYLLVEGGNLDRALAALENAGHHAIA